MPTDRLVAIDSTNPRLADDILEALLETIAGTIAGTSTTTAVSPASLFAALPVVSVKKFGAVGDGVTDDTAAIQAAIDYCVGGTVAAGATNSRLAVAALYFPPGTYLTTAAPQVVSVLGFHMFGASPYMSTIKVSGARTYGIRLDGLAHSYIHDLHIKGTYGPSATDTVRDVLALNWTTAAQRSTTHVVIKRIVANELKFTNGIAVGLDSSNRQVDNISTEDCVMNGQWTAGETTWWQYNYLSGSGVSGNILNHHYRGCAGAISRHTLYANACNVDWVGGDSGSCEIDFRHAGTNYLSVTGVRSEHSTRLYWHDGGGAPSAMSLKDINWNGTDLHADQRMIRIASPGTALLQNIKVDSCPTPQIFVTHSSATPVHITAIGLMTRQPIASLFTSIGVNAPASIVSLNYCQLDSSDLATNNVVPLWVKGLQGVRSSTFEDVEIDGALNHDGTTVGLNGSTPVTKSTGWGAPTGTATKTTFDTTTVTLPQLAERLKALIDYLTSRGDIGT